MSLAVQGVLVCARRKREGDEKGCESRFEQPEGTQLHDIYFHAERKKGWLFIPIPTTGKSIDLCHRCHAELYNMEPEARKKEMARLAELTKAETLDPCPPAVRALR